MNFRSADSVESNQNPLGVTYSNQPLPSVQDDLFDKTLQYLIATSNPSQSTVLYSQLTVAKENEPRVGMEGVCFTPLQVDVLIAALDSADSILKCNT